MTCDRKRNRCVILIRTSVASWKHDAKEHDAVLRLRVG